MKASRSTASSAPSWLVTSAVTRDASDVNRTLTELLVQHLPIVDRQRDWQAAHPYVRQHLAEHAAIAGSLDALVQDPGFLLTCAPWTILRQRHRLGTIEGTAAVNALEAATNEWAKCLDSEREWWLQVWARKTRATTLGDATDLHHRWPWKIHAAIWGGAVHRVIASSASPINAVTSLALADGRIVIASAGYNGVHLWDPLAAEPVLKPVNPNGRGVMSLAAVPLNGERDLLALGYEDGTLTLWDPDASAPVGPPLTGHGGWVRSLATVPMPNGQTLLASAGDDGTVRLWDLIRRAQFGQTLTAPHRVLALAAVPITDKLTLIASTSNDGALRFWDPATGAQTTKIWTGNREWLWSVTAVPMPDGRMLVATGGDDATIRLWDPLSGDVVGPALTGEGDLSWPVFSIAAIALAGRTMLAAAGGQHGGGKGITRLWTLTAAFPTGHEETGYGGGTSLLAVVPQESGRTLLASAGRDNMVHLWNPMTGETAGPTLKTSDSANQSIRSRLPLDADLVYSIVAAKVAGERTLLAVGRIDGSVLLWDPSTGAAVGAPLVGHTAAVVTLAAVRLGDAEPLLASGDSDGIIRLWNLTTGKAHGDPYESHGDSVRSIIAVQANERTLLICQSMDDDGATDRCFRVWDVSTQTLLREPQLGPNENLIGTWTSVAGGTLLVSGDADGAVRLWDPMTGAHVGPTMLGHVGWVSCSAAITIKGLPQCLATAGHDGTIRVWDPASGAAIGLPLRGHTGAVTELVALPISKGNITLASTGYDKTILLWSRTVTDDRDVS